MVAKTGSVAKSGNAIFSENSDHAAREAPNRALSQISTPYPFPSDVACPIIQFCCKLSTHAMKNIITIGDYISVARDSNESPPPLLRRKSWMS
jgi:hypothetical protein